MKKIHYVFIFLWSISSFAQKVTTEEVSINKWIDGTLYQNDENLENLAILIPGSGPTNRDGNQPQMTNNSLKFLAEGLAENGVSVFAYDKKFLKQMKQHDFDESELKFEDLVDDVVDIVDFYKQQHRYENIYLIGHSEGSLVGILAAQKVEVAGLISIAGVAESIDLILEQQISKQASFLLEETESILAELKIGKQVDDVSPMLQAIFRESVQPYLISWMKYDPQTEIQKLNCDLLIIQGSKDLQVSQENAEKLHQAQPNSKLIIIDEMNHVLKPISGNETENYSSYNQADLPVSEALIKDIVEFTKNKNHE